MKRLPTILAVAATVLCAAAAFGQTVTVSGVTPVAGDFVIRDFRFTTGETLPELKLHYRTLGEPRRDAKGVVRNAVLILHGTGGTGRPFLVEELRRGPLRAGPAARRADALHHPARRHRPRAEQQAERRAAREVPALHLRRHGDGAVPARHRGAEGQPPEAGDGHVDGRHAHVDVGRDLPRLHGRPRAARQRADADRRAEPDVAEDDHGQHPERPGVERRQLHRAAARGSRARRASSS